MISLIKALLKSGSKKDHEAAMRSLPKNIQIEVAKKIKIKRQLERFVFLSDLLKKCDEYQPIIAMDNKRRSMEDLYKLMQYSKEVWTVACSMYRNGRFAIAKFLGIVCMEEVAKYWICELQFLFSWISNTNNSTKSQRKTNTDRNRNPLFSHRDKHLISVLSGLLMNSRADRRLGIDNINEFIKIVENKKLESIRQSCIYAESCDGKFLVPPERHAKQDAGFYIALAGEILLANSGSRLDM